jgi:biopolymer transport protein ExbB
MGILQQMWSGGVTLLVIFGLSLFAGTVAVERLANFRRRHVLPDGLVDRVRPLWRAGDDDALARVLREEDSTMAHVIAFMLAHRHQDPTVISAGCGDIASMELRYHQQKAYPLAVTATLAPILGLLGTVIGMIEAFNVVASTGTMGDPALLAAGISKALITTASGLIVALPALALHHYFRSRTVQFGLALERQVNELMSEWFLLAGEEGWVRPGGRGS